MDTVSFDGNGSGPYKNVYNDDERAEFHLGEKLPYTVARGEGDEDECRANAAFIALARNAFDVMMRRGWYAGSDLNQWAVGPAFLIPEELIDRRWPDPFTALVEADEWYRANVEKS